MPENWKVSIVVPFYKKDEETNSSNYRGITLLSTTYKILSKLLLLRPAPYAEEVIGDHQCGFALNRSTNDPIFCIRQIRGLTIKFANSLPCACRVSTGQKP